MAGIRAEQESVGDEVMEEGREAHAGTCKSCLRFYSLLLVDWEPQTGSKQKCSHNFRISV